MFGKKKPSDPSAEWTKTGSFVHKPNRGWLHSDNSLMEGGVCYAVKVSFQQTVGDVASHHVYICQSNLGCSNMAVFMLT